MIIINTQTLEDYKEVVKWAFDQGMTWRSGDTSISEHCWNENKSEMCIIIENRTLMYCRKGYAIENYDIKILDMGRFYDKIEGR